MSNDSLSLRATMGIIKWLVALQWWPPQGRYQGRHCSHHGHFKGLFSVQQQDIYTPKHQMQDRAKREQWFSRPDPVGGPRLRTGRRRRLQQAAAHHRREADSRAPQAVAFLCSTPIRLQVRAGSGSSVVLQSGMVFPIKVHRIVETEKILNLEMAWVEKGTELKVDVPVVFKGEVVCPGLKKGGFLHKIRTSLKYLCPSENIPPKIEVDLANLDIGDKKSVYA